MASCNQRPRDFPNPFLETFDDVRPAAEEADDVDGNEPASASKDRRSESKAACIHIVYPDDAVKLSKQECACVCLLNLKNCSSCIAFAPTWRRYCDATVARGAALKLLQCDCEAADGTKYLARHLMDPEKRSRFPAIIVCYDGAVETVPFVASDALDAAALSELIEQALVRLFKAVMDGTVSRPSLTPRPLPSNDSLIHEFDDGSLDAGETREEDEDDGSQYSNDDAELGPVDELASEEVDDPAAFDEEHDKTGGDEHGDVLGHQYLKRYETALRDASFPPRPHTKDDNNVAVTHAGPPRSVIAHARTSDGLKKTVVVLFYTNWCGHCRRYKDVWNQTVGDPQLGGIAHWCAINCESDEGAEVAQREEVRGYPTVHVHHQGRDEYKGGRSSPHELLGFLRRLREQH